MEKIDLYKQFKSDYKAVSKPLLVDTTPAMYLTIEGAGAPGCELFQKSIEALYSMAFTIKMTRKASNLGDYVVCKLEGIWWSDKTEDLTDLPLDQWQWKLMIRTPDCVTQDDLTKACDAVLAKGKAQQVKNVILEEIAEGLCAQMLHVGPYEQEHKTIEIIRQFISQNQLVASGKHHEIYLSDPRRVPPERLKTILRQPVTKAK